MKAPTNTEAPSLFGSILGKEIANFKNDTATLRGYCRAYGLKPNLKAYVKYATQSPPVKVDYTYQWYRDGKPIPRATSSGYTLTKEDKGCKITCKTVAATTKSEMLDFITKFKNEEQSDAFFITGERLMKSIDDKFSGLTDKQEFELRNNG